MRNKSLFLLLACVCGTVAAIGVSQWMQAQTGGTTLDTIEIFVTAKAIGEQEEITADKIRLEQWPADKVPQGATADLKALEGRYAKQAFYAGEIVLDAKLMNEKNDIIVPKGYRVVSMKADQNSGITNIVKQGDRVDVDAYFTKSELFPETKMMPILSGVRVFAIDGKTKYDEDEKRVKAARTISLAIRKADHEAWVMAQKTGEVSLSLGSTGDNDDGAAEGEASETGQQFLNWMADHKAEQKRLRDEAAARNAAVVTTGQEEPVVADTGPKPGTFRTTKIANGRMQVYEWTPGNPVPRLVADTGADQPEVDSNLEDLDDVDSEPSLQDDEDEFNELTGENSPFFQPSQ